MNKLTIIFLALVLLSSTACKKETQDLKPSGLDKNWLVITDNPSDSLDHLIYTVYTATGVPIYYKDTVGSEQRGKDVYGNPIIYYETLDPFYSLTGTLNGAYCVPSQDRNNLMLGVKMLRDKVIPLLTPATAPKSFYLVDSIWTSAYATANVYRGYKTTVIAQMNVLGTFSDSDITTLAGTIGGGEVAAYLVANYPLDLQKFYNVSNSLYQYGMYNKFEGPYAIPMATGNGEEFGFISVTLYFPGTYQTPTQVADVSSYIVAIKTVAEADFRAQYANAPLVLQKYDLMKDLLTAHKL